MLFVNQKYSRRLFIIVTLALSSCSHPPSEPIKIDSALPFGTYDLTDANAPQPEAEVGGKLVLEDGCLYIKSGNLKYLPLFPAQHTTWLPSKKALNILGHSVPIGSRINTNGAYIQLANISDARLVDQPPATRISTEVVLVGTQAWDSGR